MRIWFGFEIFMNKNRKGRSKNGDSLKEKEKKNTLSKGKDCRERNKTGFWRRIWSNVWEWERERERQTALLWFLLIATSVYLSLSFFCFFFLLILSFFFFYKRERERESIKVSEDWVTLNLGRKGGHYRKRWLKH